MGEGLYDGCGDPGVPKVNVGRGLFKVKLGGGRGECEMNMGISNVKGGRGL